LIAYLDTSALVKRYVDEPGSSETAALIADAGAAATSIATRAEVAAALAKAVRLETLDARAGRHAQRAFASQWADYSKVPVNESIVARAESLAWDYSLRGYDAIQLASALTLQDSLGAPVTLATFDRQLWKASKEAGLEVWPERLDSRTARR
jgi:predicted nucleic acid-binding protein